MKEIEEMKKEIKTLKNSVDKLTKILEQKNFSTVKKTVEDIKKFYEENSFEDFFNMTQKHFQQIEDYDDWEPSIDVSQDKYALLARALECFNVHTIAKQIFLINKTADNVNDKIETFLVNSKNLADIENGLINDLKKVSEYFINEPANAYNTYISYQSGRIHLDSIYYTYVNEHYNIIKIYWTQEESSAGDE